MVGGRPNYLDKIAPELPNLDEAIVMQTIALQQFDDESVVRVIHNTSTTEDDILAILMTAAKEGLDQVLIVMMAFRIPRAETILQTLLREHAEFESAAIRIIFFPAEQYVLQPEEYRLMTDSAAYKRTVENERFGIRKMLSGQIASTVGKT